MKTLKQWSDRKKWVEEPLFRSYIFVKIPIERHRDVLLISGVVAFIGISGKPSRISDQQIQAIRQYLDQEELIEDSSSLDLKVGSSVEIIHGPMSGLNGVLYDHKGRHKVIIQIEAINQKIWLTIPKSQLQPAL